MTFEEIIFHLRQKDDRVTRCFFFWSSPTLQQIEEIRRTDPMKAARLPKPVCNTCRPGLLKVLYQLYDGQPFDYDSMVSDFYVYLMDGDKLASIKDPQALMGWIVRSAYFFFLNEKKKHDRELENVPIESLNSVHSEIEADDSASSARALVEEVLKAMPNRTYAKILDEVTLEVGQLKGREKSETFRRLADKLEIPVDNLYVKISLAKKQFKETAKKLNLI